MAKNVFQKADKVAVDLVAKYITNEKFFKSEAKWLVKWGKGGAAATLTGMATKETIDLGIKGIKKISDLAKGGLTTVKDWSSKVIPFGKKPDAEDDQQAANS